MKDAPSATARFVAEHLLLLGPRVHALLEVPPQQIEWTERVLAASGWSPGPLASIRSAVVERFSIPGIRTHYVLRKKIIEREVRQAIDEGCRQVVIVGAGFDVLALRLAAEFPMVSFTELDHPATQSAKRVHGSAVKFVPADLRNATVDVPLDREKATVFVVEGVLMYFSEEQVAGILQSIRRATNSGRVIITAMESDRFAESTWLTALWLKWRGEPFRWAAAPDAAAALLARAGFRVLRIHGSAKIRAALPPAASRRRVATGEYIVVAEW